jgi:hypothetical protein
MAGTGGTGPKITTDAVRRFLAIVPSDLSTDRLQQLGETMVAVQGQTADQVLAELQKALQRSPTPAGTPSTTTAKGDAPKIPPKAGGAGGGKTGAPPEEAADRVKRIREKIAAFDWTTVPAGQMVFVRDRSAKFGDDFPATAYTVADDGARTAAELTLRFTDKTEQQALVVAASEIVTPDSVRAGSVLVGQRITNIARSVP